MGTNIRFRIQLRDLCSMCSGKLKETQNLWMGLENFLPNPSYISFGALSETKFVFPRIHFSLGHRLFRTGLWLDIYFMFV